MHTCRIGRLIICFMLACAGAVFAADDPQRTYRIGNSLTWDSQPASIPGFAEQRGLKHVQAWHINCGKSLQRIWEKPDEVCVDPVEPYGTFGQALPKHEWDAVTLQPHVGPPDDPTYSTLATDTARVLDFIKLTQSDGRNKGTVFYIYAPWPGQPIGEYREVWQRDTPDADDTPTLQARAYFDHLLRRLRAKTDADVRMIPTGAVLFELDRRARAGEIPGHTTAADFFRDKVHLNHVGRYMAGVTTFAVLFNQNPAGLTCPPKAYGDGKDLNDALYKIIHESVWKVITEMNDATGVKANE